MKVVRIFGAGCSKAIFDTIREGNERRSGNVVDLEKRNEVKKFSS